MYRARGAVWDSLSYPYPRWEHKRMALTTRPATPQQPIRRIWRVPKSRAKWYWLIISLAIYGGIYAWYLNTVKTQSFAGPYNDPLRFFGIIAFALVLVVAAYTLRRRFVRKLPWKVQDWLWLHTWFGVLSLLLSLLHENYQYILHDYYFTKTFLTEADAGMPALIALFLLVLTGIIGRLLDLWQAHEIAAEANSNGVGIPQAVEERLLELQLTVERLSAGKSAAFKRYCTQALSNNEFDDPGLLGTQANQNGSLPDWLPTLVPHEQIDFRRAYDVLTLRISLVRSLARQRRSRWIIQAWRYVHIPLAILSLAVIGFHSVGELVRMI